jgi:outer membrane protein TolC
MGAPSTYSRAALAFGLALTAIGPAAGQETWHAPRIAAAPAVLPDPQIRRLSLDEARNLALGNKNLVLARLNVQQLQHATNAARKDYLPKVIGNVTYFHFNDDLGQVLTVQRGRFGLQQPGISTISVPILNQDSTFNTIMVAQPITKLIAVNAAVQLARADERATRAQLDKGTRDLLSGVAQAYYALLGTQRIQNAIELQVQLLEQVGGANPPPELRIGLIEARQGLAQARGQAQELMQQLNSLLDLPLCTVLELVDPAPCELPVRCADEAGDIAVAVDPEVREATQSIAKAEAGLKVARMEYLPDVNLIGGYQNQHATATIQNDYSFVGVTASMTLWEWNKKRDVLRQRQAQIALARQNVAVTSDKVRLAARKAYLGFEQAREANRLAQEMVQARKEAEKGATGQAAVQAKAESTKAELEAMKAEIAFRVAHAQLAGLICGP